MADIDKDKELDLFNTWKSSVTPNNKMGDKAAFQNLYTSMSPLLDDAARKSSMGSNLPKSAHALYAAQNFMDSLRTYDPNKGSSLQTHVYGTVHQKAKRLNYLYQNLGYIPEPRAVQIGNYQTTKENLKNDLGREPSAAEIADTLQVGLKDVKRLEVEIRRDLSLTNLEEQVISMTPEEEEALDYLYYELTAEERAVFDYIYGKHGKPAMVKHSGKIDFDRIAKNMGVSVSKVRSLHGKIRNKFMQAVK